MKSQRLLSESSEKRIWESLRHVWVTWHGADSWLKQCTVSVEKHNTTRQRQRGCVMWHSTFGEMKTWYLTMIINIWVVNRLQATVSLLFYNNSIDWIVSISTALKKKTHYLSLLCLTPVSSLSFSDHALFFHIFLNVNSGWLATLGKVTIKSANFKFWKCLASVFLGSKVNVLGGSFQGETSLSRLPKGGMLMSVQSLHHCDFTCRVFSPFEGSVNWDHHSALCLGSQLGTCVV